MEYLAEQGFVTVIHDHRGHGRSVRSKDDLGYMYGSGAEGMLKDIAKVNHDIRKYFPDLPLILMGHSMGSLAVRAFASEHDDCLDMLIVCGSPSEKSRQGFLAKRSQRQRAKFWDIVTRAMCWSHFLSWFLCMEISKGRQQKCMDPVQIRQSISVHRFRIVRIYLYRRCVT